ncbi:MAG: TIGR03960 family B12-binding radical SAM protein [Nitrospirae bacterium]|nr:TIGR03960 family B12-binding radical SAM protein [Nitrospirota bacterium]
MSSSQVKTKSLNLSGILPLVSRPARYIGNEWNSVHKDHRKMKVRVALAFPDVYEVGMSHLGLKILYHLLNTREEVVAERVYAPWIDMENLMRRKGIPLFSLESHLPLQEFDIIGFTLPYELSYTNILNMLNLAGLPLKAEERKEAFPLILAGGIGAFSAEPLADFIDAFVLGDGEEVIEEIVEACKEEKAEPGKKTKKELFHRLAQIEGVYIPSLYRVSYKKDGTIESIEPKDKDVPSRIRKRVITDLNQAFYPLAPLVPYLDIVHDRITLEIMRGCSRGCRFCQAGILYRPVRERSPEVLLKIAAESVKNTGYDEISLSSLSSGDYSCLEELMTRLWEKFDPRKISLSLPSLHVDNFSLEWAKKIARGKKPGFTFAPEVGSEHLRQTINKNVREEDLLTTVGRLSQAGWRRIKLYFMIGLPGERKEDLEGIVDLVDRCCREKVRLNLSLSSFVPKAHTPFQWEGMERQEVLEEKQKFLRERLRKKKVKLKWHNAEMSFLEAVFARGDRRLGQVVLKAWEKGCRFDGWKEHFQFGYWTNAFRESGLDPYFYAHRKRDDDEIFPWEHLESGVDKKFLLAERKKAEDGKQTSDCRIRCGNCGISQKSACCARTFMVV